MLQRTTSHAKTHKMAAIRDRKSGSTCSEANSEEQADTQVHTATSDAMTNTEAQAPATKQDIQDLLRNMRQMFSKDIDLVKTEV
ncbi:Hypothetical predicted protein [Pelobates cultripes]|uniref:Uncharacterized protein n=1 Tax=Pelobates cultripes TaxID=61616 RepID=A0AAD1SCX9_PELCU|nr:Hypothetical predicted protein [Pelobates cultripes]